MLMSQVIRYGWSAHKQSRAQLAHEPGNFLHSALTWRGAIGRGLFG